MPTRLRKTLALGTLRASFRAMEHLAPTLGARRMERLWFTIPPARRALEPPPGAERAEIEVYGRPVVTYTWGTGEPVYLVHGWGGSGAQLSTFVPPLVEAGFRAVTYDAPSHGQSAPGPSGPGSSNVVEFTDALQSVIETFGSPAGVIAHSLGSLATAFAMRRGQEFRSAVFVAPMADATSYTRIFSRMLGGGDRIGHRLAQRVEARVRIPISRFDIPATAKAVTTPPALVIHDTDDRETSLWGAQRIVEAWPGAQLATTSGLGHHRVLRDPRVVSAAVDFLTERVEHIIR